MQDGSTTVSNAIRELKQSTLGNGRTSASAGSAGPAGRRVDAGRIGERSKLRHQTYGLGTRPCQGWTGLRDLRGWQSFRIDQRRIWRIIQRDLPPLDAAIAAELRRIESNG
jgi:hypothetical protein